MIGCCSVRGMQPHHEKCTHWLFLSSFT